MSLKVKPLFYLIISIVFVSCSSFEIFNNSSQKTKAVKPKGYKDAVRKRLMENAPNYKFCLEKFMSPGESGTFEGSVTFKFFINKHGMVRNVAVISDHLKNIKAKGCLIKVLTTMEMPTHQFKEDFQVNQPFGITMN